MKYILLGLLLSVNAFASDCWTDSTGHTSCVGRGGNMDCWTDASGHTSCIGAGAR